jgi:hypothetical protein
VQIRAVVDFCVGGEDHEDRVDSVKMLLDDHYDDVVKSSFFSKGISSLTMDVIGEGMTNDEALREIADIVSLDDIDNYDKVGKIEGILQSLRDAQDCSVGEDGDIKEKDRVP